MSDFENRLERYCDDSFERENNNAREIPLVGDTKADFRSLVSKGANKAGLITGELIDFISKLIITLIKYMKTTLSFRELEKLTRDKADKKVKLTYDNSKTIKVFMILICCLPPKQLYYIKKYAKSIRQVLNFGIILPKLRLDDCL